MSFIRAHSSREKGAIMESETMSLIGSNKKSRASRNKSVLEMKDNQTEVEATSTDDRLKVKGKKAGKKTKDPNKSKRSPSSFFVLLDDFRREFNEANPDNKSVANVDANSIGVQSPIVLTKSIPAHASHKTHTFKE